ncbi:MAG: NAD(P)-dependent oxidoreductase [Deltaproteobacteria bacterium]|nr:MAG: NAD(P)-dependent oxidoreductase [Deltaproteobacteria bacterium]TMQ06563.1 MAG: NAD(P)-dependent oxidoreductase [Deltaproteobacteria bacterium]
MIAFFGMGLLGSNFVRALRRRGEDVHVWNRSHDKAAALEAEGARAFRDPAEAARGAARVHVTLTDDAAVDAVLEQARAGIAPGTVIVDHSTTSTEGVLARIARWRDRGITFVHAPVFMGPQNARDSTGFMLLSGPPGVIDPLRPVLAPMTGKLVDLGERPEAAAAFKLLGNLFLIVMTAGMADMLALAKALHVPTAQAAALFDSFNPGVTIPSRIKRMAEASFSDPSWALTMARKDTRLMLEAAAAGGVELAALPGIAKRMDAAIAEGHGAEDWTVIAKDAVT